MVSLLKAAHLTLFHMLGHQYVVSGGGRFLGYDILGKFFLENVGRAKRDIVAAAYPYFREFVHMMRPMLGAPDTLKGTADDQMIYICERGIIHWGMIVLVRTSPTSVHAVLAPLFEGPVGAKIFLDFLHGSADEKITARPLWFRGDHWEGSEDTMTDRWPKSGLLYPEQPDTVDAPAYPSVPTRER
jgi:hypothetical protein